MTQKPQIQYIGQFYVMGSEARAIQRQQRKKPRTKLPMAQQEQIQKIYVDPVAVLGIAVAVFMLVVMVMGALRIRDDWKAFGQMESRVVSLRQRNVELTREYRDSFNLEDIRSKAQGMGMIPRADAETKTVRITPPIPAPERTWLDDVKWFFEGLLVLE